MATDAAPPTTGPAPHSWRSAATRTGLKGRILIGLFAYTALLTIAVLVHGAIVNEHAEQLVWESLLQAELDHFEARRARDPDYRWTNTETLELFEPRSHPPVPSVLDVLPPGVHDELMLADREVVVLVRGNGDSRRILALDITALEAREADMTLTIMGSAVALIILLGLVTAWGVGRLVRPLSTLALDIGRLQPDRAGQHIAVPGSASAELVVIADALNDYLRRNERFCEREHAFIDSASHELRTPIAVIAGATELALGRSDVPDAARNHLQRIARTAADVEQLISLLLVLAKDPARLAGISEPVALDRLLPEIVEDHRHLTRDKDLLLTLAPLPACAIVAPLPIVQAAIGNLLRNAIENSDRGEIVIGLTAEGTVVIDDPGHGMSPEEISAIYATLARGGGNRGGGIGLDLIARLCEHLGWTLEIDCDQPRGTRTTLAFGPAADDALRAGGATVA